MARLFDNWLRAYAAYTSDSESPVEFHFWSGVWTIAGALRRRVWLDMRKFQWTPNFYIVLVGPAGIVNKSTSIRNGQRLLERIPGVKFGPPSITWQKLVDSLQDAAEFMKYLDSQGQEALVEMACLNVPVSELGTFLKVEDAAFVDVLVDLWDGQLTTFTHSTKTSGAVQIRNPWLNVMGCTTPSWLKAHFPDSLIGGGLTSRIIFVYGDAKTNLVPYPDEMKTSKDYLELEERLVTDLMEISKLAGEMKLSAEARAWGHEWYEKHWDKNQQSMQMTSERYGGYKARKQTHLHKLAIILSVAESDRLIIEKHHLEMADGLLQGVEPHMIKVFESIGVSDQSRHVGEILPFIRAHGVLTPEELYPMVMNLMSTREFREACFAAKEGGLIHVGDLNGKKGFIATKKH